MTACLHQTARVEAKAGDVMKLNILVFGGSGKIGAAVAWDLVKANDVGIVGLIGRREDALDKARAWIDSPKIRSHVLMSPIHRRLKA